LQKEKLSFESKLPEEMDAFAKKTFR